MKIALIQLAVGSDRKANLRRGIDALAQAARRGAELIVFPELSFTRFYPQFRADASSSTLAEPSDGETVRTIADSARTHGVLAVINLFERDAGRTYDTTLVIETDGRVLGKARMLHITDYERFYEQGYYAEGDTLAPVFETSAGRIGVCICYDRHFPEYMRSLGLQGADLVVIPQAGAVGEWPDDMYTAEIRVASFQNGYYCAMANRVGVEDQLEFAGESVVTDPFGSIVAQAASRKEELLIADIDLNACNRSPARSLFLKHRRPDIYEGGSVRIIPPNDGPHPRKPTS